MDKMESMEQWRKNLETQATLSPYQEKRLVFGDGSLRPQIMLIGEAPGGEEEKQGRPFVGKAGKNLTEFLTAIALQRKDLYISNVVKFRPTKESPKTGKPINRPPSKEEIAFFLPFLQEEIRLVNPKWIVTLGNVPLKAVTGENISIGDCHGTPRPLAENRRLFPLYHPAAVIYNRSLKETYHADLQKLKAHIAHT